jgi:hypothetical protein
MTHLSNLSPIASFILLSFKCVKVFNLVFQMAAPKPWETSIPMSSQPIPSSFDTINNGFGPTIEQPYVFS